MPNTEFEQFNFSSTKSSSTLNSPTSQNSKLTMSICSESGNESFNSNCSLESFENYRKTFLKGMKKQEEKEMDRKALRVEARKLKNAEDVIEGETSSTAIKMKKRIKMPEFKILPQNFNIAKQCPEGYIPCPRNCKYYILKQCKFQHIHSTECPKFKKLILDEKENPEELKEQLDNYRNQAWRKKNEGSKEGAFVYGFTNKIKK